MSQRDSRLPHEINVGVEQSRRLTPHVTNIASRPTIGLVKIMEARNSCRNHRSVNH
jgi:hypothetical protein